jgi:hypothetical protein
MNEVVTLSLLTRTSANKVLRTLFITAVFTFTHGVVANTVIATKSDTTIVTKATAEITTSTATESVIEGATKNPTKNDTPVIFTAHYKANIKGFAVKASRELKTLDNGQFALSFNATSWAAEVEESSVFSWADGKIQPVSYRYYQNAFGKKREQNLTFNNTDNTINSNNNGDERVITRTAHTLDKLNYQLQLQQDLLASSSDFKYAIVDKGNLKDYRFETLGEEAIDTHSGSLNTIKVKVIRENKDKTTYIWFAKDWNNLLAKLEQYNGDKLTLAINLDTATVNNISVKGD